MPNSAFPSQVQGLGRLCPRRALKEALASCTVHINQKPHEEVVNCICLSLLRKRGCLIAEKDPLTSGFVCK